MNQRYFFIFGNHPALAMAEILAVARADKIDLTIDYSNDEFVILSSDKDIGIDFFDQLGGSQKYGEIKAMDHDVETDGWPQWLQPNSKEERFNFGISLYGQTAKAKQQPLFKLGLTEKKRWRQAGFSVRLVQSREPALSSVIVKKENIITKGAELVCLLADDLSWLGQTLAVQDFDNFSRRDYGKPARDSHSGMLPPKLARMMLNVSSGDKDKILLDPFCGSGTILLEAMSLDWYKIQGSDQSAKAVADTIQNTNWYKEDINYQGELSVRQLTVENLVEHWSGDRLHTVVTEPYLGPPHTRPLPEQVAADLVAELTALYQRALGSLAQIMPAGAVLVMIIPVLSGQRNMHYLSLAKIASSEQWHLAWPGQSQWEHLSSWQGERQSFLYKRSHQVVQREIVRWRRL
ncbi:MAG: TRM11 family SAM-dependent methyltransferase [Candidatus Komeilibacteria bacterium]